MPPPAEPLTDAAQAKRRQILAGAREAFCELGYERASVDLVASRAGVAKATVYHHFADKKALFIASFSEEADGLREALRRSLGEPAGELEPALRRVGEQLVETFCSRAMVALHRYSVSEAVRFPEVGEVVYARGPAVVFEAVAEYLRRWEARGALQLRDAGAAAVHFILLCQADLVLRAQLGVVDQPDRAELRETVRRGVAAFLRAYRA